MKMTLRYRIVLFSAIGFALGMFLGEVITAVLSTSAMADGTLHLCAPEFEAYIGDDLTAFIIQAIVTGIYGAIGMGGSSVYWIEEWSILKATVVHFCMTIVVYFLTAGYLRWFSPLNIADDFLMLGIFLTVYVMIWLSYYLVETIQIKEINKGLMLLKRRGV